MIDVQGNLLRFFAIDHVLVTLVTLLKTIATTGAIFSLQFTKKPFGGRALSQTARTRWGSLSAPPDPLAAIGGLLLKGGEGRGGEGGKGMGKEGTGKEGRGGEEKGREEKGGETKGGERRGREGKEDPMNVGWLRACL